jgi:predicted amidophosphoribosyltransferase
MAAPLYSDGYKEIAFMEMGMDTKNFCYNCKKGFGNTIIYCPLCGSKLVTISKTDADGLEELIRWRDSIINIDTSSEGLLRTTKYLDNVMSLLESYQYLILTSLKKLDFNTRILPI